MSPSTSPRPADPPRKKTTMHGARTLAMTALSARRCAICFAMSIGLVSQLVPVRCEPSLSVMAISWRGWSARAPSAGRASTEGGDGKGRETGVRTLHPFVVLALELLEDFEPVLEELGRRVELRAASAVGGQGMKQAHLERVAGRRGVLGLLVLAFLRGGVLVGPVEGGELRRLRRGRDRGRHGLWLVVMVVAVRAVAGENGQCRAAARGVYVQRAGEREPQSIQAGHSKSSSRVTCFIVISGPASSTSPGQSNRA